MNFAEVSEVAHSKYRTQKEQLEYAEPWVPVATGKLLLRGKTLMPIAPQPPASKDSSVPVVQWSG